MFLVFYTFHTSPDKNDQYIIICNDFIAAHYIIILTYKNGIAYNDLFA